VSSRDVPGRTTTFGGLLLSALVCSGYGAVTAYIMTV